MIDGDGRYLLFDQITTNCLTKERLNACFINQNVHGERLDLIHHVCSEHINEVHFQNDLLKKYRLAPAGWSIEYRTYSQDNFYAEAGKNGSGENDYAIGYSLGIPATLLSIAIELESKTPVSQYQNSNRNSINDWFPQIKRKDEVSKKTIDWVLDACLLIYFHEVCHIIFGHCEYKARNNSEVRAIEMDADFNAGSMFGLCLDYFSKNGRRAESGYETLTRAIKAGFLVGVALKAISDKSESYHFPTSRVLSFNCGCMFSLIRADKIKDFGGLNDEHYEKFAMSVSDPLLKALRKSSLKYFAGIEKDIGDDYKDLMAITVPLREKLKDGPLKEKTIPIGN